MCGAVVVAGARRCPSCGEAVPDDLTPPKRPFLFWGLMATLVLLMYPISFGVVWALIALGVLPDSSLDVVWTIYGPLLWLFSKGKIPLLPP